MPIIPTELFDKLTNLSISKRDRELIYVVLALCAAGIGYMLVMTKDTELHRIAMNGLLYLTGILVIVFVAAGAVKRTQAGSTVKAVVPAAPSPSPVTVTVEAAAAPEAAPAPIVAAVEKVKADTTAIRKKVKA